MDSQSQNIIREQDIASQQAGAAHEAEAGKHKARAMGADPLTYTSEKVQQGYHSAAAGIKNTLLEPSSEALYGMEPEPESIQAVGSHEAEAGKHKARALGADPLTYVGEKVQQGYHSAAAGLEEQAAAAKSYINDSKDKSLRDEAAEIPAVPKPAGKAHKAEAGKHKARAMGADPLTYVSEKAQQGYHNAAAGVKNVAADVESKVAVAKDQVGLAKPHKTDTPPVEEIPAAPKPAGKAHSAEASKHKARAMGADPLTYVSEKVQQSYHNVAAGVQNQAAAVKSVVGSSSSESHPLEPEVPPEPKPAGAAHEAEAGKHAARAMGADPLTYIGEKAKQIYHSSAAVVSNQVAKAKSLVVSDKPAEAVPVAPPMPAEVPAYHAVEADKAAARATGADPLTYTKQKAKEGYHRVAQGFSRSDKSDSRASEVPEAPAMRREIPVVNEHAVEADKHAARATGSDPLTYVGEKAKEGYHRAAAGLDNKLSDLSIRDNGKPEAVPRAPVMPDSPLPSEHAVEANKHAARATGADPLTYVSEKAQQGYHSVAASADKFKTKEEVPDAPAMISTQPAAIHQAEADKHAARAMGADPLTYVGEKAQQGYHAAAAGAKIEAERARDVFHSKKTV